MFYTIDVVYKYRNRTSAGTGLKRFVFLLIQPDSYEISSTEFLFTSRLYLSRVLDLSCRRLLVYTLSTDSSDYRQRSNRLALFYHRLPGLPGRNPYF